MNSDEQELLNYALSHGMIDIANIRSGVTMTRKEEILKKHPHKIWQGKDNKWRTYIHAEGYPKNLKLVCKTTKEALEDAIIEAYEEEENIHTFEEVFNDWNNIRLQSNAIAPKTHLIYTETYKRFLANNKISTKELSKVKAVDWQLFLESSCNGISRAIFGNLKSLIKGTLKRAKKLGYIDYPIANIFETLEISDGQFQNNIHADSKEVYSDDEFEIIEKYVIEHPSKNYLGVLLIFVTGLRIGELCALTLDNISDDYIIHIVKTSTAKLEDGHCKRYIKESTKTLAGMRDVPVPESYYWVIDNLKKIKLKDGEHIFSKHVNSLRQSLRIMCKKCGIEYKPPHKIRKTYCSTLLDNNVNPKIVAKLAGHSSSVITMTVYNKDKSQMLDKQNCVNDVFNTT